MAEEKWYEVRDERYGSIKIIRERLWSVLKKKTYNGKPQYTIIGEKIETVAPEKKSVVAVSAGNEPQATDDIILKHIGSARTLMAIDRIKSKITPEQLEKFGPALDAKAAEISGIPAVPVESKPETTQEKVQSKPTGKKAAK